MKYANSTIDVVIPTYKPGRELNKVIERLLRQTYCINRIIIVNTLVSGFESWDFKKRLSASDRDKVIIRNIEQREFNHGLTRNLGLSISDADYVVFMTQDAMPADNQLIEELIKPFADEEVYVTYARQLPRSDCKYVERYVRSFNYPDKDIVKTRESFSELGIKAIFCSDVCAAYKRKGHIELGGFKRTDFNEDMIFAYDALMAGKKVYYASGARVIHSHNYSYLQQLKRNIEIGRSQKRFAYIFGKLKSEDEGIKLLKRGISHFVRDGKWYYIPDFIFCCGFKYIGFRIGKLY